MKDKRSGKLDKHFSILCDGKKVSVLRYEFREEGGGRRLVIKTMVKSDLCALRRGDTAELTIPEEARALRMKGQCDTSMHKGALFTVGFQVQEEEDLPPMEI